MGERSRIIHALGYEAAREATIGGAFLRRRSEKILGTVEQLARSSTDPYDQAWLHLSLGTTAYARGRWRVAREHCDAAVAIWRERCTGVSWQIATGEIFAVTALAHMGELGELTQRLPRLLADAENRGDVYATTGLRTGMLNLLWLIQDQPDQARVQTEEAIAAWRMPVFHAEHYLHLLASVQIDLYLGDGLSAWRRVVDTWPKVRRGHFLRMEMWRVELFHLRARAALGAAAALGGGAGGSSRREIARLLRVASRDARRVARNSQPSAGPFAAMIRAGVAQMRGRPAAASTELTGAIAGFEQADMALYRSAAEYWSGALAGGADGREHMGRAERYLCDEGVRDVRRMMAVLAPGSLRTPSTMTVG